MFGYFINAFILSLVLLSRLTNSDKLLKDKDSTLERQPFGQLIMEEDISPMDKVPKVELKIETELETKTSIADENSKEMKIYSFFLFSPLLFVSYLLGFKRM